MTLMQRKSADLVGIDAIIHSSFKVIQHVVCGCSKDHGGDAASTGPRFLLQQQAVGAADLHSLQGLGKAQLLC